MATVIRPMMQEDIATLTRVFAERWKWRSTHQRYQQYWQEQHNGQRLTLLALCDDFLAGYVNVLWAAPYQPFQQADIPIIHDLSVAANYRRRGIGRALMLEAEAVAVARGKIVLGLGCGVTAYYSAARLLYQQLGYLPDGRGEQATPQEMVIYMTKQLPCL